jgi:AraC-like DNA-binding protein
VNGHVFEQVTAQPAPELVLFVADYVGYRMEGFPPGIHAGLPSHYLTFIVSLGDPIEVVAMPDPAQRPRRFAALVGGLHAAPAMIRHDGNQHGLQLKLTPTGARALFGQPAGELASSVLDLGDLLGPLAHELTDRVNTSGSWTARFAAVDDVLIRALRDSPSPRPELTFTWSRLVNTAGGIDVRSVASEVAWSRRHLSEQFRIEYGHPPKVMARVMRFERARRLLVSHARPALADVAAACGYADQAHLTRDWRALAGQSPRAWLASEHLPFVQDDEVATQAV